MASEVSGKLGGWCPRSQAKKASGGEGKGQPCQMGTGQGKEDLSGGDRLSNAEAKISYHQYNSGNQKSFLIRLLSASSTKFAKKKQGLALKDGRHWKGWNWNIKHSNRKRQALGQSPTSATAFIVYVPSRSL